MWGASAKISSSVDIEVSLDLAEQIEMLAPFGNGNPKPVFKLKKARIADVRYMGNEEQHVRFSVRGDGMRSLTCVLFNRAGDMRDVLRRDTAHDIIGSVECQVWQGQKRLQFIAENIID